MLLKFSLMELHKKRKITFLAEKDCVPFEVILFTITLRYINGLPFYEVCFEEDAPDNICSNNAVDIVIAINRLYDLVVVP